MSSYEANKTRPATKRLAAKITVITGLENYRDMMRLLTTEKGYQSVCDGRTRLIKKRMLTTN